MDNLNVVQHGQGPSVRHVLPVGSAALVLLPATFELDFLFFNIGSVPLPPRWITEPVDLLVDETTLVRTEVFDALLLAPSRASFRGWSGGVLLSEVVNLFSFAAGSFLFSCYRWSVRHIVSTSLAVVHHTYLQDVRFKSIVGE